MSRARSIFSTINYIFMTATRFPQKLRVFSSWVNNTSLSFSLFDQFNLSLITSSRTSNQQSSTTASTLAYTPYHIALSASTTALAHISYRIALSASTTALTHTLYHIALSASTTALAYTLYRIALSASMTALIALLFTVKQIHSPSVELIAKF